MLLTAHMKMAAKPESYSLTRREGQALAAPIDVFAYRGAGLDAGVSDGEWRHRQPKITSRGSRRFGSRGRQTWAARGRARRRARSSGPPRRLDWRQPGCRGLRADRRP